MTVLRLAVQPAVKAMEPGEGASTREAMAERVCSSSEDALTAAE